MAMVSFTPHLRRHVDCDSIDVVGHTIAEVLDSAFNVYGGLRGYVVDDQGRLRKHVVIFINGEPVCDRLHLTDPVAADADVYVMQALSGG
jgi:molybdopterin synthase sulfur carrier subunit